MDISSILSGLKDKVLDAAHFELLKSAYQLQEQNIAHLKSNNEAHRESVNLQHEKIERLERERDCLAVEVEKLRAELEAHEPPGTADELSEESEAVMGAFLSRDATTLDEHTIRQHVGFGKIELNAAIDELKEYELISLGSISMNGPPKYRLSDKGKKLLAVRGKQARAHQPS